LELEGGGFRRIRQNRICLLQLNDRGNRNEEA
jgi:hypothetical protein